MFAESWIGDIAVTCGISQRQVSLLMQYPGLNSYSPNDLKGFEGRNRQLRAYERARSKLAFWSGASNQAVIAG